MERLAAVVRVATRPFLITACEGVSLFKLLAAPAEVCCLTQLIYSGGHPSIGRQGARHAGSRLWSLRYRVRCAPGRIHGCAPGSNPSGQQSASRWMQECERCHKARQDLALILAMLACPSPHAADAETPVKLPAEEAALYECVRLEVSDVAAYVADGAFDWQQQQQQPPEGGGKETVSWGWRFCSADGAWSWAGARSQGPLACRACASCAFGTPTSDA